MATIYSHKHSFSSVCQNSDWGAGESAVSHVPFVARYDPETRSFRIHTHTLTHAHTHTHTHRLVVNTDSKHYCILLAQYVSELVGMDVEVGAGVADLSPLMPSSRTGGGQGASYFDRLWNAGAKKSRYHIDVTM